MPFGSSDVMALLDTIFLLLHKFAYIPIKYGIMINAERHVPLKNMDACLMETTYCNSILTTFSGRSVNKV